MRGRGCGLLNQRTHTRAASAREQPTFDDWSERKERQCLRWRFIGTNVTRDRLGRNGAVGSPALEQARERPQDADCLVESMCDECSAEALPTCERFRATVDVGRRRRRRPLLNRMVLKHRQTSIRTSNSLQLAPGASAIPLNARAMFGHLSRRRCSHLRPTPYQSIEKSVVVVHARELAKTNRRLSRPGGHLPARNGLVRVARVAF